MSSTAIVQRACAKLRSALGDEAVVRLNFNAELREMFDALEDIQPVLEKADMGLLRDFQLSGWLWYVREAAYKAMDMVDELQAARTTVFQGGQSQEDSSLDVVGMGHIMERLRKLLNCKKVLLVLDDLWEEDPIRLELLKSMLTFLSHKMDVIVTTCNQAIARTICTIEPYKLNPLSDAICWKIIKEMIQSQKEDKEEELEKIGLGWQESVGVYRQQLEHMRAC
ncbi:putative disease resistance protein RGA1 [Hordeum vulgare]|nr:putative disease resistance protein RGA1 [Hordeum vulgare]